MRKRQAAWIASCIVLAAACSTDIPHSVRQINEHADEFDGKDVKVQGYLLLGTNGRSLYQSAERFETWKQDFFGPGKTDFAAYAEDCLTLMNVQPFFDHQEKLNQQTIVVEGKFVKEFFGKDVVDGQRCASNPSALVVTDESVQAVIQKAH